MGRISRGATIVIKVITPHSPLPPSGGCVAIVKVGGRAGGHSFGIIKRWSFHGSRRAENPDFSAALRIRLSFADNKRGLWISSSPADASSFTPSRPDYDTVSKGGWGRFLLLKKLDDLVKSQNWDGKVKSRHSGGNRSPEIL